MRIDKINNHMVRCFLNAADLREREMSITDVRYGNPATMELFRDVIEEATLRYGFNSEDLPLVIEAIPCSPNEIELTISVIEDMDELDPHFANYAPADDEPAVHPARQSRDGFMDTDDPSYVLNTGVFSLENIDEVMSFCKKAAAFTGSSVLYRSREDNSFYLVLNRPESMDGRDFRLFLNSMNEFGERMEASQVLYASLLEHDTPVMEEPVQKIGRPD